MTVNLFNFSSLVCFKSYREGFHVFNVFCLMNEVEWGFCLERWHQSVSKPFSISEVILGTEKWKKIFPPCQLRTRMSLEWVLMCQFIMCLCRGRRHTRTNRVNTTEDSRESDGRRRGNWRENRHPNMGHRRNIFPSPSHNSRHMWLLCPKVFQEATLQRWQERHERRWSQIGTVTWICL